MSQRLKLPATVHNELRLVYKDLDAAQKSLRKLLGDPRTVIHACEKCGAILTARQMRRHKCREKGSK